jgi:serine phosphatase RsbU (regulator of sigma subunit)
MNNNTVMVSKKAAAGGGHAKVSSSKRTPVFNRYVIFSVSLFVIIVVAGSITFFFSMRQIIRTNKESELARLLQVERIKLETSVEKEIALVLRMAGSSFIRKYFENPSDPELAKMAEIDIAGYRKALMPGTSVFWVNDADKMFHIDEHHPFLVDGSLPENYWYSMTLHKTQKYNFNINFNPHLNITNLWINAPVWNNDNKAIGMLGMGLNLSTFINAIFKDFNNRASLHFFNADGEITGARDVWLVATKKNIKEELGDLGTNAFLRSKNLKAGEVQTFSVPSGEAAVIAIPVLEWYAVAFYQNCWSDFNTPITAIFIFGIIAIALILILSNIFIAGLLVPLRKTMQSLEKATDTARAEREEILSSIRYARKIQKNLLPDKEVFQKTFADYSIIWKPRDFVGGDIYWIKKFDEGAVLCVCDCTGHGTPGALLTMLVMSALETIVWPGNCNDTAAIIWELEQRLVSVFRVETDGGEAGATHNIKDGCDLAVVFIAKEGGVTMSAGHMNVFICDGEKVQRIRGQKIFVGEGKLKSADDVKTIHIPYAPENKFYIASDGLFDQPGGKGKRPDPLPFGYKAFEKLIMLHHYDKQSAISDKIWAAFEKHRGDEPRVDDFELITFKP